MDITLQNAAGGRASHLAEQLSATFDYVLTPSGLKMIKESICCLQLKGALRCWKPACHLANSLVITSTQPSAFLFGFWPSGQP
jgi:hypothetical protein